MAEVPLLNELSQATGGSFSFSGLGQGLNTTITVVAWFIGIGFILFLVWWILEQKKYNILIIGMDRRGSQEFYFFDKAKEIISYNKASLKLKKRKNANVIIPNLKFYRSTVAGGRVIHIYKYGAVNDYVVVDPSLTIPSDPEPFLDQDGNQMYDDDGNELVIHKPRFELKVTESLSKEHSIRDLRDAWARFQKKDTIEKYGAIIAVIVIGLTLIVITWIMSKNMVTASENHLEATKISVEVMKQWLEYQQSLGTVQ